MDKAEDEASRKCEVEKLSSLVSLVDLLLETGPDVDVPDHGGPSAVYGAADHTEVDQPRHQQTLLDSKAVCVVLN